MRWNVILLGIMIFVPITQGQDATQRVNLWKAGVARAVITPEQPLWLAGYGGRTKPSEGKLHDLWIKALALEDAKGRRVVLLTSDLCGLPKWMYDSICAQMKKKHGLEREHIRLTNSHNHCAPAVRGELEDYYPVTPKQQADIDAYSDWLEKKIVETLDKALADMRPASLQAKLGACGFAVNRRNNREADVPGILAKGGTLAGPVDHSVPVLAVRDADGKLRAVVFGYACHNTTLSFYQWCGDYAGFAQIALAKSHPGATAMFMTGCGGDQNPLPRRTVELCEKYGNMLAKSVDDVLAKPVLPLPSELRTAHESVTLKYERPLTRKEFEDAAKGTNPIRARWAAKILKKLDAGATLPTEYPYAVQAWRLGDQLWIALGGEALVGYSHRFKAQYGDKTWVTSYAHDLTSYIPTRRNWEERGYEVDSLYEYSHPAERWAGDIEDRVAAGVARVVEKVKR